MAVTASNEITRKVPNSHKFAIFAGEHHRFSLQAAVQSPPAIRSTWPGPGSPATASRCKVHFGVRTDVLFQDVPSLILLFFGDSW